MNDESGHRTEPGSGDAEAQHADVKAQRSDVPPSDLGAKRAQSGARQRAFFTSVDATLLGLGSQMMSEVVAGVLLGYGLDYLLGTKNRWIVVGSIAGIAVAMVTVFRIALKQQPPRPARPGTRGKPREMQAAPDRSNAEGSDHER
jgi:F0F1-type ATP synthase assembly protein I